MSLRELDIKVNTNYQTVRDQIEELVYFGKVEVILQCCMNRKSLILKQFLIN